MREGKYDPKVSEFHQGQLETLEYILGIASEAKDVMWQRLLSEIRQNIVNKYGQVYAPVSVSISNER